MLDKIRKRSNSLIGLDIGTNSVKLLMLSQQQDHYQVEGFSVETLPDNAVIEKEITDIEAVSQAIQRAYARMTCAPSKKVVASISGPQAITRTVDMPISLTEDEIEHQVYIEANNTIPYPINEISLDYEVIGPNATQADKMDVLIAATRKDNVDKISDVLMHADLRAKVVDIDFYALERALHLVKYQMTDEGKNQTIAIVDIGQSMTTISVFHDLHFIYAREQMFGAKQLEEDIQQRYGLCREEVLIAIKHGGLPDEYAAEVLEPFKYALVQQINRGIQFFYSSSELDNIDQILLAGGAANITNLESLIQDKLSIPAQVLNPFANMSMTQHVNEHVLIKEGASFMVCCGLALRSFSCPQ